MRIAEIEVLNLYMEYPERRGFRYAGGQVTSRVSTIVRVLTENGVVGLGASYAYPDIVRIIVEKNLRPHLLGADPCNVEALWEKMYSLTRWYGRKGAGMSALGALDTAFWDLRAKSLGKPLYAVLGGERDTVPAYASGLFWQEDPGQLEKEAARHRQRGFKRVKTRLGHSEAYDLAALQAIRRGVGPDGGILVDGSHRYTVETAEKLGKVLAEQSVFWFEEPFPPEDIDSYVALLRKLPAPPLAAGENEFGLQGFRELLRAGAIGVAQPDACRVGGITECVRVAKMAAESGVGISTHTWSDAVALMANAHFVAAMPNGLTVEVDQTGNPFIEELLTEPLRIEDGLLRLPDAPGLGIELNETVLRKLTLPPDKTIPDGNYSDLIFGAQYYSTAPPYQVKTIG
jgi:L-alanine-DL-glutamate epimerase-like enolase superfamily enzyme